MKKILEYALVIFIIMAIIGGIVSCCHEHSFVDGKCECGEEDPNYVPPTPDTPGTHEHSFVDGKCECGEEDPNYVPPTPDTHEHSFVDGKCECGEEDPNYVPPAPDTPGTHEHTFVDGKCECGEEDPNYVPPTPDTPGTHEHTFVDGKCECGEEDPNYVPPTVEPVLSTLTYVDAESGEHSNPAEYTEGTALTLLDAERRGYTFLGWYNSNNEKISEISSSATGDITLTAKWELNTYTITYENTKFPVTSVYPTSYTVEDKNIALYDLGISGYTFLGWYYKEPDGSYGGPIDYIATREARDVTVAAKWELTKYTITYENTKNADISSFVRRYTCESETFAIPDISAENYTFDGWYDSDGKRVTEIAKGTTGDIILTAAFTPYSYNITYLGVEAAENANPATYMFDIPVELSDAERRGYDFLGWYDIDGKRVESIPAGTTGNVVLTAGWELTKYTITYENTKNADTSSFVKGYTCESETFTIPDISAENYTFDGWYDSDGKRVTEIAKGTTGDIILTAAFTPYSYNITYLGVEAAENTNPVTYMFDILVELSDAERRGYDFLGWYDVDGKRVESVPAGTTGDVVLTAGWELTKYKITYENTKNADMSSYVKTYTMLDADILLPTISLDGYTFDGWYNADGERVTTIISGSTGDVTLTARWDLATYTITYENTKTVDVSSYVKTYTMLDADISLPEICLDGYIFGGWYNADGERVTTVISGSTGDVTLTAKWELTKYTITYENTKAADVSSLVTSYTVQDNDINLPSLMLDGYIFGGWYNADGERVTTVISGSIGDVTLTAKWELATYTITYVNTENADISSLVTSYTVQDNDINLPSLMLDGYTFSGWYNADGERIATIISGSTGDITLTAKWELTTYTITYENTKTVDISSYVKTYTMLDADILLPTISLDGYTFGGWEIDGQKVTSIKSGSVGNIVVRAIMIPLQYTLLLETPYGKLESKTVTVGYGEHYTLPVISYEGKTFLGWYDNTGDSGVQYTDGSGNSVAPYPHTSGRMLYARFEALSCIVSYDTMGGDPITSAYVDYGSAFDDSVIPTKENAIFAGWYNSDFSSRYTSGSVISSDITVYAKWIESTPISTAEELIAIANNPTGNYYLTCDINLNGTVWTPIDTFSGTLDGKGYKIKNFALHTPSYVSPYGFIRVNYGTIQNITLTDVTFNISLSASSSAHIGVLVGNNEGNIYNCFLESGALSVSYKLGVCSERVALGGICGRNYGNIADCRNEVNMTFHLSHYTDTNNQYDYYGYGLFGAVVGFNSGTVSSCSSDATLTYSSYGYCYTHQDNRDYGEIGGIVGRNDENATISDCYSLVTIDATTSRGSPYDKYTYHVEQILYMGGIVGVNMGETSDSYATGTIVGKTAQTVDIGGAIGQNRDNGSVINCYAKVDVASSSSGSVGGFIGYNNATVQNCYSTGSVNSVSNTGGFAGSTGTGSTISKCYSTGDVTSTSSNSGFFIGANSGILYNCYFMRGAMLLVNGQYKDYTVEKDVVEGVSYSTIWSKEFLVDTLYWDSEGWIILANEDPILEWEISVDHNYNKIIIEPTCTTFGFTVYKCTDCDRYFIMDVVAEHGHDITHSTVVAPTCTERGYTASYCSRCDETVATDLVDPTGHTQGELVEHHAPTCTEDGYDIYSCTVCSVKKAVTVVLEATSHTEVVVPAVEQTCTEQGKTERIYCGVCKTLIKASTVIEPHFYHITVTHEPTCTEAGECTKYCVVCEHTVEGAAVAPTGHTDLNGDILCDTCGVICGEYADDVLVEISTAEQLAAIADNLNGVYRLMANITLPSGWKPIGSEDAPFTGFLDGNGYKITLCSFENKAVAGIFGYNDGVITNLAVAATGFTVSNMNAVVGGIAAYNSGLIIGCNLSGTFDLTVISTHTSSAHELSRVMRNVVFGGLVGINEQGGRLVSCNYDAVMQVSLENTALCTAKYGVFDYIDITGKYKNIIAESIVTLTVSPVVGRNGGEIVKCRAFGGVMLGKSGNGSGLPSADAQHFVGNASAESIYYYGDIAGYNYGTVSECENWHTVEMNVSTDEEYYSFLFCSERAKNLVYLTFTGES